MTEMIVCPKCKEAYTKSSWDAAYVVENGCCESCDCEE